jgi:NAD(P)-dependent dehydrogenase (short-subunit alcohol dehydrogenase family)
MGKTWLITGASRGLGKEFAKAALIAGNNVVATARNAERVARALGRSDRLLIFTLDVTKPETATEAVKAAIAKFGRIDILVNNAGYGQLGSFEETSDKLIEQQFATNVFGTFHVTRAVLPFMRDQKAGHVFTISSLSGLVGGAGASVYAATKFALEGWMESLRPELEPFGIRVTLIEPGYFNTDFLDSNSVRYGDITIAGYADFSVKFKAERNAHSHNQAGDPAKLATAILKLADADMPPLRFVAGSDCLAALFAKAESYRKEGEQWRELSVSTDRSHCARQRAESDGVVTGER